MPSVIRGSDNFDSSEGGFASTTYTQSSSFTKPNDAYSVYANFFSSQYDTEVSGVPNSNYEILVTSALASDTLGMVSANISSASTHVRRDIYWGDLLLVGKKNTVTNKSMAFYNMAAGWTTQTIFPVSYSSEVKAFDANDRLVIWGSDVYTASAAANSNLVLAVGASTITTKLLT